MPLISGLCRLHFLVIQPRRLEFPAGRQLQRIVVLANGILLLKVPRILQHQRMLLHLIFISNNISRIGSGYLEDFHSYVADQLAAFNLGQRHLGPVFVFYLVVLALSRDAPAVQVRHLPVGVDRNQNGTVIAAARTEHFICLADCSLDLIGRDDIDVGLRIEQHSIGLLFMSWQWSTDLRVHPRRSIPGSRKLRHQAKDTGNSPEQD